MIGLDTPNLDRAVAETTFGIILDFLDHCQQHDVELLTEDRNRADELALVCSYFGLDPDALRAEIAAVRAAAAHNPEIALATEMVLRGLD